MTARPPRACIALLALLCVLSVQACFVLPRGSRQANVVPGGALLAGDNNGALRVGDVRRTYLLHIPPSYDGRTAAPLVLAFHGALGTGLGMSRLTAFSDLADREDFVVVYPDGLGRQWNDGRLSSPLGPRTADDVGFVAALVAYLKQNLNVDPKRVYATGISNGAMMCHRLACEMAGTFAAIGPVAGTLSQRLDSACAPQGPVPVVMFHGTEDSFVPFGGGAVRGDPQSQVLSAPETALRWGRLNGCPVWPQIASEPPPDPAGPTRVQRLAYGPCPKGGEVVLYTIEGGGHTWPGGVQYLPESLIGKTTRAIDATQAIWEFFESHPKP